MTKYSAIHDVFYFMLSKFSFKLLGADVSIIRLFFLGVGECAMSSDPLVKVAIQ